MCFVRFFMLCSLASRFPCLVQEKTVCLFSSFVEKHWNYWWLGLYEDHSMDLMRIILSTLIIWMTFEICCLLLGDKYSNNGILSYDQSEDTKINMIVEIKNYMLSILRILLHLYLCFWFSNVGDQHAITLSILYRYN